MKQQHQEPAKLAKVFAYRMRSGKGINNILTGHHSETHFQDALERFQKDFATYDHKKREQEKSKKQSEMEKKRLQYLERQNRRWEIQEQQYDKKQKINKIKMEEERLGIRRTANSNGLAYNPINLTYDKNPEGDKLKNRDQDNKIRGYVRAHNMDNRGNSKYNLLTGQNRVGIEKVIPNQLTERYEVRLNEHYDGMRLKPPTSNSNMPSPRNFYY